MTIPTSDSITTTWLTDRLRAAGHDADVRGFTAEQIGTGQIGKCVRYKLDLARADATTPHSLVGKFPSDDPISRATGVQLKNFIKEVSFYRELQPRLSIPTPRCYFADIDGEGPDFVLLLEDLAPARQGDQLEGCNIAVAEAAVNALVGLHAPSWCDASLRGIDWLAEPSAASSELGAMMYRAQLPGFMERYGAHLEADERAIIEQAGDHAHVLFRPLATPFALVHIDYRLDNLLIDTRSTPPRVTVVDWQSITLGNPVADAAYFLGAGLLPDDRRANEERIVRGYHARLVEAGVSGYDWRSCWQDYRRGTFAGFSVTVIASMLVQRTSRGDEMFIAMAKRHARHAIDRGGVEFFDE